MSNLEYPDATFSWMAIKGLRLLSRISSFSLTTMTSSKDLMSCWK